MHFPWTPTWRGDRWPGATQGQWHQARWCDCVCSAFTISACSTMNLTRFVGCHGGAPWIVVVFWVAVDAFGAWYLRGVPFATFKGGDAHGLVLRCFDDLSSLLLHESWVFLLLHGLTMLVLKVFLWCGGCFSPWSFIWCVGVFVLSICQLRWPGRGGIRFRPISSN